MDFEPIEKDKFRDLIYDVRRNKLESIRDLARVDRSFPKKVTRCINSNDDKILHLCAELGRVELFRLFCDVSDIEVNCANKAGETPLMIACREGKMAIV